jgi:hypothetical protein
MTRVRVTARPLPPLFEPCTPPQDPNALLADLLRGPWARLPIVRLVRVAQGWRVVLEKARRADAHS